MLDLRRLIFREVVCFGDILRARSQRKDRVGVRIKPLQEAGASTKTLVEVGELEVRGLDVRELEVREDVAESVPRIVETVRGGFSASLQDANFDDVLPIRSDLPLICALLVVAVAMVPIFWWMDLVGVASLMAGAFTLEAVFALRRHQQDPMALCRQGLCWWWVERSGEISGPYWLAEDTRISGVWIALCLRDSKKRKRRVFLIRWRLEPEPWRKLMWHIQAHHNKLAKARNMKM
ncbi:hypothetical protein HDN1F_08920 [gamma proteobacterium HdN1]|nr:hypothetical protein HDN1F_08920 [gamma proteobacterium HdN1]